MRKESSHNKGRDFRSSNLQGASFRGQDLTDADFSQADIRGANFTGATLIGAKFIGAKAGLENFWIIINVIAAVLLSIVAGFTSALAGAVVAGMMGTEFTAIKNYLYTPIPGIVAWGALAVYLIFTIWRGFLPGLVIMAISLAGVSLTVGAIADALLRQINTQVLPGLGTGAFVLALAVVSHLAMTLAIGLVGAVAIKLHSVVVMGVVTLSFFAVGEVIELKILYPIIKAAQLQHPQQWFDPSVKAVNSGVGALNVARALVVFTFSSDVTVPVSVIAAGIILVLGCYTGWRSLIGDERFLITRNLIVFIASLKGTSFRASKLSDACFANAWVQNCDFSQAKILRTIWLEAKGLDLVLWGNSYLQYRQVRELLITGNGKGKKFDRLFLQGVSLVSANLQGASLVGTNLSEASLQYADLRKAKLLQTNLTDADLTGAYLTEAYIQDCRITRDTKLDVRCDCFFENFPTQENPNPRRKPDNWEEVFAPGDFADFIRPLEKTLDLYHDKDIDPRKIAIALNQLRTNHPEAELDLVGVERKGEGGDKLLVRLKTAEGVERSSLHAEYFSDYRRLQALHAERLLSLLESKDKQIQGLSNLIQKTLNQHQANLTEYPCATMLPVTSQNLAEPPLTWQEFRGASQVEIRKYLGQLQAAIATDKHLLPLDKASLLEQVQILVGASQNPDEPEVRKLARNAVMILDALRFELPRTSCRLSSELVQTLPKIRKILELG